MSRVLIVGTAFLNTQAKCSLLRVWASLIEKRSAACDVLVIDSCSPTKASEVLPHYAKVAVGVPSSGISRKIHRFATDVGHPINSLEPSRDFLWGLRYAAENRYDYVVHWETDMVMVRPVMDIVGRMAKSGVRVAAPFDANMQFIETQLLFMRTDYVASFADAYEREYAPQKEFSERCVERVCGDDLFILPLRGMRNHYHNLTAENMCRAFPHGIDYLSHCDDFTVYTLFLERTR